jgi:PAS domain S-box-containing protein
MYTDWKIHLAPETFTLNGNHYFANIKLGHLGVVSDITAGLADYCISIALIYFIYKRGWKPLNEVLWLSAIFFAITGSNQIWEIWTQWYENYWLGELRRAINAFVSLWGVVLLVLKIPKVLAFPNLKDLEKNNQELTRHFTECKQVECSLRLSQAKLDNILNNINVSIVCFRAYSNFSYVYEYQSKGSEGIFGYTEKEILADKSFWMSRVVPEDVENVIMPLFEDIFAERPAKVRYRFNHKDGTVRWICGTYISRRDEEADCWVVTVVSTDITERKQAEEKQRRTSALLSTAERLARVGSWEFDVKTQKIIWSEESFRIYGLDPNLGEPSWADLLEIVHPDDRIRLIENCIEIVNSGTSQQFEYRIIDNDGLIRYIQFRGEVLLNSQRIVSKVFGAIQDITEWQEAKKKLHHSEALLARAERLAHVGSWEIDLMSDKIIWSKEMFRIYGFGCIEFEPTKATFLQVIHPKDRSRMQQIMEQAILKGISYEVEFQIMRPDGSIRYLESRGEPIFNGQEKVIKLVGSVQDITERKQVEKERLRLVAILEASTDHISMINAEGNILWNNAQAKKILGLPLGADITRVPISHYHPQWALKVIEKQGLPTAISKGSWVGETALLRGDGSEMAVSQMIIAHKSFDGRVEYFSTIMRDISESKKQKVELKEAKEAAEAANRAKSEFIARMSHELRTPLNSILGFTQLMHGDNSCLVQHRQYLDIINKSGQHLLALINDVLEMSKIEAGRVKLHENSFDLYHLLNSLEQMLRLKATEKQLNLVFKLPPDLPQYIITDEGKLRQVLLNLIGNAIKFTQQGYVKLQVAKGGSRDCCLSFEVRDTGTGIALEEMSNLFNAFVQTQSGRTSQEGTGLGLPISQKFVHLMGGDITVNSVVGQGSIFAFDIQYKLADTTQIKTQIYHKRVKSLTPNQTVYRLLIVDDAWEHRQFLLRLLASVGFEVGEAENGKEGVQLWQSWQPHLIFMDMQMPVMNGYEATQEIKATIKGQATVIVALTASALDNERSIILSSGCDDFISKPFRPEDIFDRLSQHLGVSYIYSDSTASVQSTPSSNVNLSKKDIAVMPDKWLQKLHEAACSCSDERIFQLLEEIPQEHKTLLSVLRELAYNFRFDKIIKMTS